MGGFFSALFGGSNPTLAADISNSGAISGYGTSLGQGDISDASNFYKTLLSGNPQEIGQLLGPQLSDIQQQGQQQIQNQSQFGNRSGGVNAANQQNIDTQRQGVEQLISQLTGGAAQGLTSIGQFEQGLGLQANQINAQQAQQQFENQQNSLLSKVIGSGIGSLESFGLGSLEGGGLFGGGGGGGGGIGDYSNVGSETEGSIFGGPPTGQSGSFFS